MRQIDYSARNTRTKPIDVFIVTSFAAKNRGG
jgi:hypothetical protein